MPDCRYCGRWYVHGMACERHELEDCNQRFNS